MTLLEGKSRVNAKLLIRNDLILIKKNSFSKERFYTYPRFESEGFWNSWPISGAGFNITP